MGMHVDELYKRELCVLKVGDEFVREDKLI